MDVQTISAILSILTVAFAVGAFFWSRWRNRPRYRRITRSTDWAWGGIKRLHEAHFSPDVRDDIEDMKNWIEQWRKARRSGRNELEEILLVAQRRPDILGYLYGQYYRSSRFAFISYYGIDGKSNLAKECAADLLMEGLFNEIDSYGSSRGIISELEEAAWLDTDDAKARRERRKATSQFRTFSNSLRSINKRHETRFHLYRLLTEYFQPLLREEDLSFTASSYGLHDFSQWLVVIPTGELEIREVDGKKYLAKGDAAEIMRFLFEKLYWDAFDTPAYRSYLQKEMEKHINNLPELVQLEDDYRKLAA